MKPGLDSFYLNEDEFSISLKARMSNMCPRREEYSFLLFRRTFLTP